ncbi:MAG: tRNA pseudouridine(55) synthase TruB [Nitrospirae bacterium]|nr:tRNA pseudouridine(55) synthase TruB [Candidatus Troglogloeales bacterium]MBI3598156.1 tRNA pseudouridine(55) synthase TruB [Candidatus Troglogloeales bacterium]
MITAGVINIDKPSSWTSHDVVAKIRSLLKIKRVGHAGTLDPMATGVLPICFGAATKISSLLMNGEKEYEVTLRLGQETDTQDAAGKVLRSCIPPAFSTQVLEETLAGFVGTISQMPPIYSAIKIGGVPLYKLARKGLDIERAPRLITIKRMQLLKVNGNDITFNVTCSKGTYVRTLCADIGTKLAIYGHAYSIRRLRAGFFSIDTAITLDAFRECFARGEWEDKVTSISEVLKFFSDDSPHLTSPYKGEESPPWLRRGRGGL